MSDEGSGSGTILSPAVYKWALLVAMSLLFLAGMVIAYEQATGGPRERTRIVNVDPVSGAEGVSDPESAFGAAASRFRSGDPAARAEALVVMMTTDAARGTAIVREALGDPHPQVRQRALEVMATYQVVVPGGTLAPFLSDPDPGVRAAAAGLATGLPYDASLMYQLGTPLGSGDPAVVGNALGVWTRFAGQDPAAAAQALGPALASGDPGIVMTALGSVGVLPVASQGPLKGALLGIASRLAGTPAGDQAAALAAQIP